MSLKFEILFQLQIAHDYYENQSGNDIRTVPTATTVRTLKKFGLLARETKGGIKILGKVKEGGAPVIELDTSTRLLFALHLTNPSFLNFTELPERHAYNQGYYLNNLNLGSEAELTTNSWVVVKMGRLSFDYSFASSASVANLKVMDPKGAMVMDQPMSKSLDEFKAEVDLEVHGEGKYTFIRTIDGVDQAPEHFLLAQPFRRQRPFAFIEIYSSELSYLDPKAYEVKFTSREVPWKYILVFSKDYTGSTIQIKDTRESPLVAFKADSATFGKGQTVTFTSGEVADPSKVQKIKYREQPIRDFDLVIEKNGLKNEIEGLPNPSIHQVKPEMHINI